MSRLEGGEDESHTEYLHRVNNESAQQHFGKDYSQLSKKDRQTLHQFVGKETGEKVQQELENRRRAFLQGLEEDSTVDSFLGNTEHIKANEKPWDPSVVGNERKYDVRRKARNRYKIKIFDRKSPKNKGQNPK